MAGRAIVKSSVFLFLFYRVGQQGRANQEKKRDSTCVLCYGKRQQQSMHKDIIGYEQGKKHGWARRLVI